LMAARTTLPLACWNCGMTRSQMCSDSFSSSASYLATAPKIAIRPHSVHSPRAMRSREMTCESRMKMGESSAASWISVRATTALATTCEQGERVSFCGPMETQCEKERGDAPWGCCR